MPENVHLLLSRQLLSTLEKQTDDNGRVHAILDTLKLVETMTRAEVGASSDMGRRSHFGDLPGWDECSAEWNVKKSQKNEAQTSEPPQGDDASAEPPVPWWATPVPARTREVRKLVNTEIRDLIHEAPGPLTSCLRGIASVLGAAVLACQWGCFEKAMPMVSWCATVLFSGRTRWEAMGPDDRNQLWVVTLRAWYAYTALEYQHHTLAIACLRRLTADMGALARAAARIEGCAVDDPVFSGPADAVESIAGLDRKTAALGANDLARAFDITPQALRAVPANTQTGATPRRPIRRAKP